ncbi:MAG: hypothetical protein HYV09_38415 [Deltaproteobacteria bacterium]|nr:hypothetical protein [Deltaproteobacteria bacterium]
MDTAAAAEQLLGELASGAPCAIDDALAICADLHVSGEHALATRLFRALGPRLGEARRDGWARTRLEILGELERVHLMRHDHGPLLEAIARATLAGDEGPLDELVERDFQTARLPSEVAFAGLTHLHGAYVAALEVPRAKRRISDGVKGAILLAVITAVGLAWDLLPALLHAIGFQRR